MKNRFNLRNAAKIVVASLAVVAMFTSCEKNDDNSRNNEPQLSEEEKFLEELWANMDKYANGVPIQAKPEDDRAALAKGENTFIGYGINLFSGPTIGNALKAPLLKQEKYNDVSNQGGNAYIWSDPLSSLVSTSSISENFSEVYSGLNISAGLETGKIVPFFSGSVQAEYGSSSEVKNEAKFYKYLYSATTRKQTIDATYKFPERLSTLVKEECIASINSTNTTPDLLFNALGTHIVLAGSTGGSVSITGIYNSNTAATTQDVTVALNFQSSWVNGQASTSMTDKQKAIANETSISVVALGGTVSELANPTIPTIGVKLENWAKTVDNGPTLAEITDVMPIWELATDDARKEELKNYFYSHADQINQELLGYFTKGTAPVKTAAVVDGGVYYIRSWISDNYAIHMSGTPKQQEVLHIWDGYSKTNKQSQWIAVKSNANPGYFAFKNVKSNLVMDIYRSNLDDGRVLQYAVHMGDNQLFKVIENSDGTVLFESKLTKNNVKYYLGTQWYDPYSGNHLWVTNKTDNRRKWIVTEVQ